MRWLLVILLFSCNEARRVQRAEQTVITQPQSFSKVGLMWSTLHPCANDSVRVFLPGVEILKHDTTSTVWHDSIYNWSYDTIRIVHTLRRTDTIRVVVVDRREAELLQDSINRLNVIIARSSGTYEELNKTLTSEKKRARMYLFSLIVLIVVFSAAMCVKLKLW